MRPSGQKYSYSYINLKIFFATTASENVAKAFRETKIGIEMCIRNLPSHNFVLLAPNPEGGVESVCS